MGDTTPNTRDAATQFMRAVWAKQLEEKPTLDSQDVLFAILMPLPNVNALIYRTNGWDSMAGGYFDTAGRLADAIDQCAPSDTNLIFPMLYCYRHAVELSLKSFLLRIDDADTEFLSASDFDHKIDCLMSKITQRAPIDFAVDLQPAEGDCDDELDLGGCWETVLEVCALFSALDPTSMRFRYPTTKDASKFPFPNLYRELGINGASDLKNRMEQFRSAINNLSLFVGVFHVESKKEPE